MITPSLKAEIVSDRFDERFAQITNEIDSAMMRAGQAGKEESDHRVKVRTGFLRNSTKFIRQGQLAYIFLNDAPYAGFINFGTRYIAADHFFDIAAQVMIRTFLSEAKRIRIS